MHRPSPLQSGKAATPRPVSPAQAAGISRVLSAAGLKKAVEIHKGEETAGYWASPRGDHVRVEYVPWPWGDSRAQIDAGIERCRTVLEGRYEVRRVIAEVALPGGWQDQSVLEVRRR